MVHPPTAPLPSPSRLEGWVTKRDVRLPQTRARGARHLTARPSTGIFFRTRNHIKAEPTMATYHDLLFVIDETTSCAHSPPSADDTKPPPVVRRRRLVEKRPPPSEVTPTWPGGERYATSYADILGSD